MKYEEIPRYCPKCGALMIFLKYDEYGTCFFRCNHCQTLIGD
jgi:formate dehydrogenase maturation protein FdhE